MPRAILTGEFKRWVENLRDERARIKINQRIRRFEVMGAFGDVKSLGSRVYEMRVHFGPGYRLYFTNRRDEVIILLCGSDKGRSKPHDCPCEGDDSGYR